MRGIPFESSWRLRWQLLAHVHVAEETHNERHNDTLYCIRTAILRGSLCILSNLRGSIMYTITYYTHEQFYAGINELVRFGLGFKADHDELTITLTGEL